jgi:CDP-diacylglycerol--glycerol-3-phosphate 3-phosphatidyltransferase
MSYDLVILAAALAVVLLSMGIFRLTEGGRDSEDRTGRGGAFFLGFWVRNWFYWFIQPVTRVCLAMGLTPFFFNILAVLLGIAAMVFYVRGQLPTAGWMVLLCGFADVMDGQIARARGMANATGAFLDSTLDRFSEFTAFIGLSVFFGSGLARLSVLIALGGSLLVSYTRARGESLGVLCKGGLMQRAERILLLGLGSIIDPSLSKLFDRPPGFVMMIIMIVIAVGTVGTAIYRTVWIARKLQKDSTKTGG